jgi:hypothetical protein
MYGGDKRKKYKCECGYKAHWIDFDPVKHDIVKPGIGPTFDIWFKCPKCHREFEA